MRWDQPVQVHGEQCRIGPQTGIDYRNASFVAHNRVVFNIKGNDYRLVVAVLYRAGVLFVKFVGTHEEYDRINVASVEHKT